MAKNVEEQKRADVESAIRSLYEMFPDVSSCNRAKTRKAMEITARIKAREKELEKDAKLVALKKQLHEEQQQTIVYTKEKHRQVDALLRKFRLRGATTAIIEDVEKLAKDTPVVLFSDDCY